MRSLKIKSAIRCGVLVACVISATTVFAQERMPNIVFILVDDLGWKDAGFMGSAYYETPNLDKLASQGMVFTNAYAAAANCAPSRACLMSGKNTPYHGIYTVGASDRGKASTRKLIPVENNTTLPYRVQTLAETLQSRGYHTAAIGKWHLGSDPLKQGFDFFWDRDHKGHFSGPPDAPNSEYLTDRLTAKAMRVMEEQKGNPFFLYVAHHTPHTPLEAPRRLIEKYTNKAPQPGQGHATYAAMIESLDTNVGRLLKKLDDLKLSENTLVIFTSDNGGIRAVSDQSPLRGGKGSYYEGGIRVPLVIRWPGKIAKGSNSDVPVTNLDFYPTFLDLLGGDEISKDSLDGTSLVPVFEGKSINKRALYWHFPIYLQAYDGALDDARDPLFRTRPGAAIRYGDWKLHKYYEDCDLELFNLKDDLSERKNVSAEYQKMTNKLHQMLLTWQKEVNAPLPKKQNPSYRGFEK